jgi:hypothetical protein
MCPQKRGQGYCLRHDMAEAPVPGEDFENLHELHGAILSVLVAMGLVSARVIGDEVRFVIDGTSGCT